MTKSKFRKGMNSTWLYNLGVPVPRLEHMYSKNAAYTLPVPPGWLWSVCQSGVASTQRSAILPRNGGQGTVQTNKVRALVSIIHPQPVDLCGGNCHSLCSFDHPSIHPFIILPSILPGHLSLIEKEQNLESEEVSFSLWGRTSFTCIRNVLNVWFQDLLN